MELIIVLKIKNKPVEFWTGEGWSLEYPDAVVFSEREEKRARLTAMRVAFQCVKSDNSADVRIIADYGYEHETEI